MSKNSLFLDMTQFLGVANKNEVLQLSASLDVGFSFSDTNGSMIFESGFLSEGFRKGINNNQPVFIPEEQIKMSIDNSINKNFPIKFNHDFETPSPGMVTDLYFDETKKMLIAVGMINHKQTAEVIRRLTQAGRRVQVSVTVFGNVLWNDKYERPELHNLRYNELSIVDSGANPNTFIKMKD